MSTTVFTVDDGIKTYTFKNKKGEEFGTLTFNPADTNIVNRYQEIVDHFNSKEDKEKDMDKEEFMQYIHEMESDIMDQFDVLCGRKVSEELFKTYRPCAVFASGDMYVEWLLETVGTIIEKELDVRLENKKAKIKKALRKK